MTMAESIAEMEFLAERDRREAERVRLRDAMVLLETLVIRYAPLDGACNWQAATEALDIVRENLDR